MEDPEKTTPRHARPARFTILPTKRAVARTTALCGLVVLGTLFGLSLLWLAFVLVAGLTVWGSVSAVEHLREAQRVYDRITARPDCQPQPRPSQGLAGRPEQPE